MAVNFDKADERRKYIESRFSDLLDNINRSYGSELMERLVKRLEKTLEVFDADMRTILTDLDEKDRQFNETLPEIERLKQDYLKHREKQLENVALPTAEESGNTESDSATENAEDADDEIIRKIEQRRKKR